MADGYWMGIHTWAVKVLIFPKSALGQYCKRAAASCCSRCKPPLMLSDPAFEASRRVSAGTLSGRCPDSADRPLSDRAPHGPPESSRRSTKMRPGLQGALASVMTGPLGGIKHVDGESNRSRTHCSDLC